MTRVDARRQKDWRDKVKKSQEEKKSHCKSHKRENICLCEAKFGAIDYAFREMGETAEMGATEGEISAARPFCWRNFEGDIHYRRSRVRCARFRCQLMRWHAYICPFHQLFSYKAASLMTSAWRIKASALTQKVWSWSYTPDFYTCLHVRRYMNRCSYVCTLASVHFVNFALTKLRFY